jgi:hypothetical protein
VTVEYHWLEGLLGRTRRRRRRRRWGGWGSHGPGVDLRHAPFVERDADVALDPGERVLLADGDQHVVAGNVPVGLTGRNEIAAPLGVARP